MSDDLEELNEELTKLEEKEEKKKKNATWVYVSAVLCVTSIIVWILAVVWHPFGEAQLQWHVVNGMITLIFFFVFIGFANRDLGFLKSIFK